MRDARENKWRTWWAKRASYSRFRQILLGVRDGGLVLVVVLCLMLALFASPRVLSAHPGLRDYVRLVGHYFGAVYRLSVGALHPQVSQLVFAVGWSVAIIPFIASLLHSLIYSLWIEYSTTKATMKHSYERKIVRNGRVIDILSIPVVTLILGSIVLGDAGIINRSFGWVNGFGMTKAHISTDQAGFVRALLLQMYESRLGLGVASFVIISVGIIVYSSGWLVLVFNGPIWLRRRLGRNNGGGLEPRD